MKTPIDLLRRITRGAAGCLLGGALMVPMGGSMIAPMGPTTTSQAVNQINSLARQPLPSTTPRAVVGEPAQWVTDRVAHEPGAGGVVVPRHWGPERWVPCAGGGVVVVPAPWERRLEPHKVFVPSLTVRNPQTGVMST